jgi:hypothetical protein
MCKRLTLLILGAAALCVAPNLGYAGTLVAHWPLDGNVLDTSGNNYNGTANGKISYTAGMYGQAAEFHGAGDYVAVANNPGLQLLAGTEFSVGAYVKTTGLGQQNILIHGLGCSTWASWFLGVQGGEPDATLTADSFVFGVRSAGGSAYTGVAAPAVAGEWFHIVATHDGTTLRLYTNGEERGSIAAPMPYNSGEPLHFGGDPGCSGRSWYTGLVDDVFIFSKAMSVNQVRELGSGSIPTWVKAEKPIPADGTIGVAMPLLQWSKGDTAALHSVYLGTSPDLTEADLKSARSPMTMYYHAPGLQPGTTYYWRVDEIDKDGVTVYKGDVWSFMTQDVTAYYPNPANKANAAATTPTLTWMAGVGAMKHHLYFGDNLDAVTQGAAATDKGVLDAATFAPPALESLTTYYWRVDEILTGDVVKTGPVWTFTTCLPIDDFESYTDDLAAKTTIFDTWIDGLTNGLSGSTVGYAQTPFAEQTIVHGGKQSMPLDYNNVKSPFYSEAEQEFASAQNWTASGVDTLVLYVRGRPINTPAKLYVVLTDASNKSGTVTYADTAVVTSTKWTEWKLALAEFSGAGVNLAKVKKIAIGVGDKANPAADGTGLIFVDDIRLAKP